MGFAQSLVALTQRGERGRVADEQSAVQQRVDGFIVELCAEVRVLDPVLRRQGSERRDFVCRQFHGFVQMRRESQPLPLRAQSGTAGEQRFEIEIEALARFDQQDGAAPDEHSDS